MSNIKSEIVKTLKNLLGFYSEETLAKVYSEAEIKISQREVGGKVELVDAEGNLSDAPDGDYEMEDGFKFTVKGGIIDAIDGQEAPEEAPKEEAPVEQAEDAPSEDTPEAVIPDCVEELKAKVSELEGIVQVLVQAMEELKGSTEVAATKEDVSQFSKQVSELNATIKQLAKVPVEFSKTSTNNTVKDSKEEKLLEVAKMLGRK